jgi:hypothetical protein
MTKLTVAFRNFANAPKNSNKERKQFLQELKTALGHTSTANYDIVLAGSTVL